MSYNLIPDAELAIDQPVKSVHGLAFKNNLIAALQHDDSGDSAPRGYVDDDDSCLSGHADDVGKLLYVSNTDSPEGDGRKLILVESLPLSLALGRQSGDQVISANNEDTLTPSQVYDRLSEFSSGVFTASGDKVIKSSISATITSNDPATLKFQVNTGSGYTNIWTKTITGTNIISANFQVYSLSSGDTLRWRIEADNTVATVVSAYGSSWQILFEQV